MAGKTAAKKISQREAKLEAKHARLLANMENTEAATVRKKCYDLLYDLQEWRPVVKHSVIRELQLSLLILARVNLAFVRQDMERRDELNYALRQQDMDCRNDLNYAFWRSQYTRVLQIQRSMDRAIRL